MARNAIKNPIFVVRLKELLQEKRIQQKELALAVGVSPKTINSYFCTGALPSIEILVNIAQYLNVSADYLLGLSDENRALIPDNDPLRQDILVIRKAYSGMSDRERLAILQLVKGLSQH